MKRAPLMMGDKLKRFNNIFVKNFADQLNDDTLRELFSQFGKIVSAKVAVNEEGESKGFGYVSFVDPNDAAKAMESMHSKEVGGRIIYCGRFKNRAERRAELEEQFEKVKMERSYLGVNVYIKNLDESIDDDRLWKEFCSFGTITSAKVMTEGGRSKRFGFVCFSSPEEAMKAVTGMNGRVIGERTLYVAMAQRKEDRRAQLASRYTQHMAMLKQLNENRYYTSAWMPMCTDPRNTLPTQWWENMPRARSAPPVMMQQSLMPQAAAQSAVFPGQGHLTASMLAAAPPQEQKRMLGERLFPRVHRMYPEVAGRITDLLLLEINIYELLYLLESQKHLEAKVEEVFFKLTGRRCRHC
ncbi:embryonic polyadenylate-binding protein-like [Babylonia areolata]|uniref:embryonic polyadenylate-binding protein-like n=1 Tax=Babylonia areolata TaxID=304850 RepID=UPI003FD3076D